MSFLGKLGRMILDLQLDVNFGCGAISCKNATIILAFACQKLLVEMDSPPIFGNFFELLETLMIFFCKF